MFPTKSSVNLKVVGAEGHSPESLRDAASRGAKFVIYSYNFSLVVMSFKRPSNIYFIPPGQNRIVKGLPFTLVSLVFGWWGIPWGIVYTFQSLHQNLTGGTDVTQSLLATLAPEPAADGTPSPPPPLRPAPKPVSGKQILILVGAVVALAAVVYPIVCFSYGQNLRVAIVSGLANPYAVELNGTSYKISANHSALVSLAEGDFVLRGAPGVPGEERFAAHSDFFSRPFDRHVLVINPDRAALVYRATTNYHKTGTTQDPNEKGSYELYTSRTSYFLPEPDYFFEEFPDTISMPSGTSMVVKSRITVANDVDLPTRISFAASKLDYDAMREYLGALARFYAENEFLERQIQTSLKPDDARKLFESHLADRPVLVEWHRDYQTFMGRQFHAVDLLPIYRRTMEAEPDDGALTYLYARLLRAPDVSRPLYEKALRAKHPSAYAAYALGTDEFASGHYTAGLEFLRQAQRAGLHSDSLQLRLRDTLFALGRFDEILADLKKERAKDATDTDLFVSELLVTQAQAPNRANGQKAIATFLAGVRKQVGGKTDLQPLESYLNARLLYALGDEREFSVAAAKLKGALNVFEAAVSRRDHLAAVKALAAEKQLPAHYSWLFMLTAHAAGDPAAADAHFKKGVAALAEADTGARDIAQQIATNTPASHAEILHTLAYADELRVLFTALGVRFPAYRDAYFARARELDHDPAFPHLLLQSIRQDPPTGKKI